MLAYVVMILSAAALVVLVYRQDRHEKEPWYAIFLALITGFGAMWVIGLVDDGVLRSFRLAPSAFAAKAATIALIEEGGKFITILLFAVVLSREFNDPMDGLIYGRLIGVGMAVNESLLYLSLAPPTLATCGAEIVRLFGHSLMAGLIGFAIGLGGHPNKQRQQYPLLACGCLVGSTLLHFGWDWVAYNPADSFIRRVAPIVMMAGMLVTWSVLCRIAEAKSKGMFVKLAPENSR